MYVAENGTHEVSVVHLEDGHVAGTEFVTDEFGVVDGLALDAEDRLYAPSIGDNAVYRSMTETSKRSSPIRTGSSWEIRRTSHSAAQGCGPSTS